MTDTTAIIAALEAAQTAAITAVAEYALLTGEGTAATAGPSLQDLAEAHARVTRIDRYLDAVEAEARESLAVLVPRFDADPSAQRLDSINYLESVIMAVLTARRILRTPDLFAAAMTVEANSPPAEHPWRIAHGRLALRLIANGAEPDALERIADLLL